MATDQAKDPEVQSYRTTRSNLVLQGIPFGTNGVTFLCDTSTGNTSSQACSTGLMETSGFRPDSWFVSPLNTYHSENYCLNVVWNGMQKQVGDWTKACIPCQSSKIHTLRPNSNSSVSLTVVLTTFMWI